MDISEFLTLERTYKIRVSGKNEICSQLEKVWRQNRQRYIFFEWHRNVYQYINRREKNSDNTYDLNNTKDLDITDDLDNIDKLTEQNSSNRKKRKKNRDKQ